MLTNNIGILLLNLLNISYRNVAGQLPAPATADRRPVTRAGIQSVTRSGLQLVVGSRAGHWALGTIGGHRLQLSLVADHRRVAGGRL